LWRVRRTAEEDGVAVILLPSRARTPSERRSRPDRLPAWSRSPNGQARRHTSARARRGLGTTAPSVSCSDRKSEENRDLSALSFARGTPHATELKRLCRPSSLGFLLTLIHRSRAIDTLLATAACDRTICFLRPCMERLASAIHPAAGVVPYPRVGAGSSAKSAWFELQQSTKYIIRD